MVGRRINCYHSAKAGELLESFAMAVSEFDPSTAGRAQGEMMRVELRKLADRLQQAETEIRHELGGTEELQQTYHRYLYAARVLQRELDEVSGGDRGRDLEMSLTKLLDELERLNPLLERVLQEDHQAEIWTSRLRTSCELLAKKLEPGDREASAAKRSAQAAACSGNALEGGRLTTALAAISVALESMNRDVARARAEAEMLEQRRRPLDGGLLDHDPHIAAALGHRLPRPLVDSRALRDRLARLGDPQTLRPASAA